ncbi:hypothetical protein JI435_110470, partial [Parastagonospora nodorum SN15]
LSCAISITEVIPLSTAMTLRSMVCSKNSRAGGVLLYSAVLNRVKAFKGDDVRRCDREQQTRLSLEQC